MKRSYLARDIQKIWSLTDCNNDLNIAFYCHGRLPVFNEWISENAKQVIIDLTKIIICIFFEIVFSKSLVNKLSSIS